MTTKTAILALISTLFSAQLFAVDISRFHQDWTLDKANHGTCDQKLKIWISSFDENEVIVDYIDFYDEKSGSYGGNQKYYKIGKKIINKTKTNLEISNDKISIFRFKKPFLSGKYSSLKETEEFQLSGSREELTLKYSVKDKHNNDTIDCQYKPRRPEMLIPLKSCALFTNNEEVQDSRCDFEVNSDNKLTCSSFASFVVSKDRYSSEYKNFKITGENEEILNLQSRVEMKINKVTTFEGLFSTTWDEDMKYSLRPAHGREYIIDSNEESKLSIKCQ